MLDHFDSILGMEILVAEDHFELLAVLGWKISLDCVVFLSFHSVGWTFNRQSSPSEFLLHGGEIKPVGKSF